MPIKMRRFEYARLSAVDFRTKLTEIGWPDGSQFAYVYGVPHGRVQKWMSGAEDIPHAVALVLQLLPLPNARRIAIDLAQAHARPTEGERENRRFLEQRHRERAASRDDG